MVGNNADFPEDLSNSNQSISSAPIKSTPFIAESEFRRNLEAGLRTGLSATATILWAEFGPFQHPLNFFASIITVIVTLDSAGSTIQAQQGCLLGTFVGALIAFITEVRCRCQSVQFQYVLHGLLILIPIALIELFAFDCIMVDLFYSGRLTISV